MTNPSKGVPKISVNLVSLGAVFAAVVTMVFGVFSVFITQEEQMSQIAADEELFELKAIIHSNERKIQALEEQLRAALESSKLQGVESGISLDANDVSQLSDRMQKIENWVVLEPEQAVAIPLLKKDIQELARTVDRNQNSADREIGRIYSNAQWFIATLLAVIVGIAAPFVGNLMRARKTGLAEPQSGSPSEAPSVSVVAEDSRSGRDL